MNSRKKNIKDSYFGSVKFFRHLILGVVGLLILIPMIVSVALSLKCVQLKNQYQLENRVAIQQEEQIKALQQEIAAAEQNGTTTKPAKATSSNAEKSDSESETETDNAERLDFDIEEWNHIIVNNANPIPEGFTIELTDVGNNQSVDSRILTDLQQMISDAREAQLSLVICSSYRNLERQQNLFNESVSKMQSQGMSYQEAFYKTKVKIALPGNSEHQTGLAIDIIPDNCITQDDADDTMPGIQWLQENCSKYGFILRYPADKTEVTGIEYQPYCFRYVGKAAAEYIMDNGLALEEFIELCK